MHIFSELLFIFALEVMKNGLLNIFVVFNVKKFNFLFLCFFLCDFMSIVLIQYVKIKKGCVRLC